MSYHMLKEIISIFNAAFHRCSSLDLIALSHLCIKTFDIIQLSPTHHVYLVDRKSRHHSRHSPSNSWGEIRGFGTRIGTQSSVSHFSLNSSQNSDKNCLKSSTLLLNCLCSIPVCFHFLLVLVHKFRNVIKNEKKLFAGKV